MAAVVIAAMMLVSGLIAYRALVPTGNGARNAPLGSESLPIGGYAVIQAYHSNGQLYATWQGHNTLYVSAVNALAQCLSGNSTTPNLFGSCSGFTSSIFLDTASFVEYKVNAVNTMTPTGCTPIGNPPNCSGWQAQATFDFSTITPDSASSSQTNTFPASFNRAGTYAPSFVPFDLITITSPVTVNQGDRLVVTISFSVT